jgi:hypothetical protein
VDNVAELSSRLVDEREANVGAAGVADERGKGEGEFGHGPAITQKAVAMVKPESGRAQFELEILSSEEQKEN